MKKTFSIVIPAKNEVDSLKSLMPEIIGMYQNAEIIVIDDGSADDTKNIAKTYSNRTNIKIISHPYSMGNGAAIKAGARSASHDIIVFMDADGQHMPKDIKVLLEKLEEGYLMVVGARSARCHASLGRRIVNNIYNKLASWMVNRPIEDLTSGFRAVNAKKFREFLYLLPNGFSYPTTITMSFFRSGYPVAYVPITAGQRVGKSHIRLFKDGVRFLLIIFKVGTLYSPLRIFFPLSILFFLTGAGYYLYTFINYHRFTNMSALLLINALLIFLIGLVSEQITNLMYRPTKSE